MHLKKQLQVFRIGAFTLTVTALAGCASMPAPVSSRHGNGYGSATVNTAYSNGRECYAPSPDLNAAYNKPYEINGNWYYPMHSDAGFSVTGIASWYNRQSSSSVTAMGTAFHPRQPTAANRILPLPSCVRVTNLANGRSIIVLVDDRGPFVKGRIIDLSEGAASALGMRNQGTARVHIQVLSGASGPQVATPRIIAVAKRSTTAKAPATLPQANVPHVIPLPAYTPSANAHARLTAVVDQTFANSVSRPVPVQHDTHPIRTTIVTPPTHPERPAPEKPPLPAATHPLRKVPQVYLETARPMRLQTAVHERSKLQDFGISTARMVPVSSGASNNLYKIRIGPMAPGATPENYASSLERLRLGIFVVSEQEG